MNSRTTQQFRELFARLPAHVQQQARELIGYFATFTRPGPAFCFASAFFVALECRDGHRLYRNVDHQPRDGTSKF